jgi:sialic acid synthase SpsE
MFKSFSFFPDIDLYFDKDYSEAYDLVDQLSINKEINIIKFALAIEIPVSKKYTPMDSWVDPSGFEHSQPIYSTFEQRIVSKSQAINFLEYCSTKNLEMVASVYDSQSAKLAGQYCVALKISSTNITNFPLIENVCKFCNQIVVDTGNSKDDDIKNVLSFIKSKNTGMNILLQYSPSRPPMKSITWNMWKIKEMQERYQLPVGLSDHDSNTNQAILSLGLGAINIEKGIMSDRAWLEGISDSAHCIPISKLNNYLDTIITAKDGLEYNPDALFKNSQAKNTRSGLYALNEIKAGTVITKECLISLIPELGVGANELYDVIGLKVIKDIQKGEPIERKNIRNY